MVVYLRVSCILTLCTAIIFYYGALLVSQGKETLEDVMGVFALLLFSLSSANAVISMSKSPATSPSCLS